jgi:hypothetical protein
MIKFLVLVWLAVPPMAAAQKNAPVSSTVSPTSAVAGGGFTLAASGSDFSSVPDVNTITTPAAGGCGAGTDNSGCGNVGDPYQGQGQPSANATIVGCGALSPSSSGYVYRVTADIGTDATRSCITWSYTQPFVLDLNGHTVTGMISGKMNPYGITIMNGTVNCNSSSTGCIDVTQGSAPVAYDKVHHLTLNQAALGGRCINFNQENQYTPVSTRYLQIYNVQGTLPNSLEATGRSYLIWVGGAGTVSAEVWNATVSPGANLNAFQGIAMYETQGSYIHNNYIILPHPAYDTSAYDTDRGILFDCEGKVGSPCGSNIAAYNVIVADNNRAIRVRAETGDLIHDNSILNCRVAVIHEGCIHIGDPDTYTEATAAEIYNNTIELNDGQGITLGGGSASTANVHDNTATCYQGDCTRAVYFAVTSVTESGYPHPIAASHLTIRNTSFPSNWGSRNAVLSCGPPGKQNYACGINDDTASVTHCSTGIVVGNGTITQQCP